MPDWFHFIALAALGVAFFTKAVQGSWIYGKSWLWFVFLLGIICMVYAGGETSVLVGYAVVFPLLALNWVMSAREDRVIDGNRAKAPTPVPGRDDSVKS